MSETTTEQLAEIEGQAELVQVREGRWRTRGGDIRNVTPRPAGDGQTERFPWWDAAYGGTWTSGGRYYFGEESPLDLVEYLGPIEPQPEPEPVQVPGSGEQIRLLKECNARQAELIANLKYERSGAMESREVLSREKRKSTEQIEELRSEVSYVQKLLGESRQRVTHLEDLVGSLRTINEAQEKAFEAAGKENTDLQHRLNVVATEWAEQAETIRRLQIELDAAQQVPQAIADRFEEGWNQGTARAVETVLEWLEPIRAVDNEHLANEALQHLPQIMRHLTGLAQD